MDEQTNILVIEDSSADFLMIERHLKRQGLTVLCLRVESLDGLREALKAQRWDLALADYSVPHLDFQEGLELMLTAIPDLPVVMVTGTVGEERAADLFNMGVRDLVLKDNLGRLVPAVLRCLKERRELEERRRVEERLDLALRGANDGLWDWNLATGEAYFSPRCKSMLGYADEEMENRYQSWERLLHPDDLKPTLARIGDFLEGRTPRYEVEFRLRHREGHYVSILSRGFLLYGDHGEALRMVGTHVDVTEQRKLEEQYRQAQRMEAIGLLAGGVAHDFNNIISIIGGYSHLILDQLQDDDPVKHPVEEILAASGRAAALTRALLTFSRRQTVILAVTDLNGIIGGVESFLRRLVPENIEISLNCCQETLAVLADSGQIEQVIMNLVTNARDAMPDGGRLTVETSSITLTGEFVENRAAGTEGPYARVTVADNGVGMDRETRSRIFEPFFTTKEPGKGTGLGLSMAYGIVKKHDGFLDVQSQTGRGTVFSIYLPRVAAPIPPGGTGKTTPVPFCGGSETILLAEDDAALRRLASRVLKHYGYRVIEAVDGQDALAKFAEYGNEVQLVILDLVMPKKNGRVACEEMKRLAPGLKAIFMSGYARDVIEENYTFDRNTDFLHKPFAPNELAAQVRELLDRP